jgi:hypothetical protein
MSELIWEWASPLKDDKSIIEIETVLGKQLPVEFRKCIIEFNEGSPCVL